MQSDWAPLTYVQGYFGEPLRRAAFADLMADIFGIDLFVFDAVYGPDPTSMPFAYFDPTGRCVGNLSAFPLPMMIGGSRVNAIGFQSGAVRPEWRRRGLYRDLLNRALEWCEAQEAELVLLYTESPALYEAAGFRTVDQHCFVGQAPRPGEASSVRRLSRAEPHDLLIIRHLLDERVPVSQQVGLVDHRAMFMFNVLNTRGIALDHLREYEAIVVSEETADGTFKLVDVVGRRIPPLAAILSALNLEPNKVQVCFPPDRLSWAGTPQKIEGAMPLMIRGDMPATLHQPFMLPPTASF